MSSYRPYVLLFLLAVLVRVAAVLPQHQPGYMDAAYSYDIALNLARGQGFVEPFLWNYLDDPTGLPHPSHLYWMPLPTMLAWVGLMVLGESYRSAQIPFAATAALLPVVFTSLLDPAIFLMALPTLAINTLSRNSATYTPDTFHYTAPVVPFIVVSSIGGVARLSRWLARGDEKLRSTWRNRLLIIVVGASVGRHLMAGYTPLRRGFRWPTPNAHDVLAEQMLEKIPAQASVSAANSLVLRLSNLSHIFIFPKIEDAEYVAIDTHSSYFPFSDREELCAGTRRLMTGSDYGTAYFSDGLILLRRGASDEVEVSPAAVCNRVP